MTTNTDPLKMAIEALELCLKQLYHDGVLTELKHPKRVAATAAETAISAITAATAQANDAQAIRDAALEEAAKVAMEFRRGAGSPVCSQVADAIRALRSEAGKQAERPQADERDKKDAEVVLAEHSGCGRGPQCEQISVALYPEDKVVLIRGRISAAITKGESK